MAVTITSGDTINITVTQGASSSVTITSKGPKGDTGETGATGATGATGPAGADGKSYAISCVDGDNSDEEKIRLTDSDGTTDDVVLEAGTGMSIARSGDKITFTNTVSDTNTQLTTEQVQDIVGAMLTGNTETRISVTYDDSDGTIDFVVDDMTANTQLTDEQVQDIVGAMFSSNTETRISATYQDADGTIDLVVDDMNSTARSLTVACSDETTALTTGTAKATFRMPSAATITAVRASVTTAPAGSALTVDINESGSTILSTKLTIDAGEKTSTTAATAAVISDASIADDAEMTIDIDAIGSSTAGAGLKVTIYYNPA